MTLFRDEKVKWAGEEVGGIRVSHVSHIKERMKVALQESKHKKSLHIIDPLPDAPAPQSAPPEPTAEEVAACTDIDALKAMWKRSSPDRRAQIEARVAGIANEPDDAAALRAAERAEGAGS